MGLFAAFAWILAIAVQYSHSTIDGFLFRAAFILLGILVIGTAYYMAEAVTAAILPDRDLPALNLDEDLGRPRVALIYLLADDLVLEGFQSFLAVRFPGLRCFVLDDSLLPGTVNPSPLYTVVRRGHRRGAKAGNLNHWLRKFATDFDYAIILDADSVIDPDFVDRMVRYARHPENARVAVFQSRLETLGRLSGFSSGIAVLRNIVRTQREHLGLYHGHITNVGHNHLVRLRAIEEVGGFSEDFVGEDIATSLALHEKGWASQLVGIRSGEGAEVSLGTYIRRRIRIARSNAQVLRNGRWRRPIAMWIEMILWLYAEVSWGVLLLYLLLVALALHTGSFTYKACPQIKVVHMVVWLGLVFFFKTIPLIEYIFARNRFNIGLSALTHI
jgi:cellulose synthase/poly-beta-1,6-N-acetylglucosamine synthase-like glycosyltransferase